jgi:hypothetical protein
MAFGGLGNAGGLEAIASGAAREQFRRNLLNSAGNAWKEGAKALGVNLLGEMTEEQFIGALDLAFVQMEIRPGMNSADVVRQLYDTAVVTGLSSGGFSAAHGRRVMTEVMGVQGSMGANDAAGMDGPTVENTTPVADAAEATADTAIPTTEDVAPPAAGTAIANGETSSPMLSAGVFDTFTRTGTDPDARVPESEKVHRNITILRPRTAGKVVPLDISSEEAAPFREEFDRDHRAVDGFEVRKEFIPAATEAEARAEYARRHGHANPRPDWKTKPASAWLDADGGSMVFRDAQQRDGWRRDQIAHAHLNAHRGGNGPTESAGLTYDEAVKDYPFLEIMATIPHDSASYDLGSGSFRLTSSQGERKYEINGQLNENEIRILSLFPKGNKTKSAGPSSFGSDFLVTVIAYSRQMPGMTITANAARGKNMNGYAMWPKLGFEAKNPADLARVIGKRSLPREDSARMKELADTGDGTASLIKLNSTKEGQLLWRKHGDSIEVYFDTTPGNLILEDLRDQMTRRFQRSQARKPTKSNQSPGLQSE